MRVAWRIVVGVVVLLVGLFFSCASASVAEKRADGAILFEYLAQGMESIVSERRADAMTKARVACSGKDVEIEKEWDAAVNTGFGLENRRHLLVRCVDPAERDALVRARVRAETGCEAPVIEGASDVGASRVYRLSACGSRLVCDLEAREVKCKRALADMSP